MIAADRRLVFRVLYLLGNKVRHVWRLYGTVRRLYGTVRRLYGTVRRLYGTVRRLYGTVRRLYGTVRHVDFRRDAPTECGCY